MMEQPKYTPYCCGQPAKWVEQSVNLQYWFCTRCKNEVKGTSSPEPAQTWEVEPRLVRSMTAIGRSYGVTTGRSPQVPPPMPSGASSPNPVQLRFKIGDRVENIDPMIYLYNSIGRVTALPTSYQPDYYKVDFEGGVGTRWCREYHLTLVP